MLKLHDYRAKTKGLPDLLPYAALIAPGIILNKDGSFLAAWEIRGQDTDSSTGDERAYVSLQVGNAVKLLGTGWMIHVDAIRASHRAYPSMSKSHFPDAVTTIIDDERRAFFDGEGGRCFGTNAVLAVTWRPDFKASRMAGKVQAGDVATDSGLEKHLIHFQNAMELLEDAFSSVLHLERLTERPALYADGAIRSAFPLAALPFRRSASRARTGNAHVP